MDRIQRYERYDGGSIPSRGTILLTISVQAIQKCIN